MATLEDIIEYLEVIESKLDQLLTNQSAPTATKGSLDSAVLETTQKNPTIWFQPKMFMSHGIKATAPAIGGACSRLTSRGILEMQLKSEITGVLPSRDEYDPKMYRLKER